MFVCSRMFLVLCDSKQKAMQMQKGKTTQSRTKKAKRKSVRLLPTEQQDLKSFVGMFTSKTEAAEKLKISRQVLDRVLLVGSGSAVNINLIRRKLAA